MPPDELDGTLAELRRVMTTGGMLVAGFFDGDEAVDFEHQVATAYCWPMAHRTPGAVAAHGVSPTGT